MLDYAAAKQVKLLAYIYPVLPFSGSAEWIVTARNKQYASLGVRSWQDHLIELLRGVDDPSSLENKIIRHS